MKLFSKNEIDGTRAYFRNSGFQEVPVQLDSRTFSYFVLPQVLEPSLLDFVFRCTGNISDGFVFGISDHVDERSRPYAVAHEYIEFTEIGINTPQRCLQALKEELQLVPPEIKKGHILMRRDFFKNLIPYCLDKEGYTQEDLHEFQSSRDHLERLVEGSSYD